MKVLYITWGEEVVGNGVFKNQVQNQLIITNQIDPNLELSVISGVPILSRSFVQNYTEYKFKLNEIHQSFSKYNIRFKFIPIFTFSRWFVSRNYELFSFRFPAILWLFYQIIKFKPTVIHCRSYHPADIVCFFKKLGFLKDVKFIFDPRSLFPEEGILLKRFNESSKHYNLWKKKELRILNTADTIVCVSETLKQHFQNIVSTNKYKIIYTSADIDFYSNSANLREGSRAKYRIQPTEKVLVYSGELSTKGWYDPQTLAALFLSFKKSFTHAKLVVVSRSNTLELSTFTSLGCDRSDVILIAGTSKEIVKEALSLADYAANAYRQVNEQNTIEVAISKTVIASKTGEYLAMGLPILVNESVGAATQFITQHQLGISYKVGNENEIAAKIQQLEAHYLQVSQKCVAQAACFFSTQLNAQKYNDLYHEKIY